MESECECCGENMTNYYFGMCASCIRTLPMKADRIAELEQQVEKLSALVAYKAEQGVGLIGLAELREVLEPPQKEVKSGT